MNFYQNKKCDYLFLFLVARVLLPSSKKLKFFFLVWLPVFNNNFIVLKLASLIALKCQS